MILCAILSSILLGMYWAYSLFFVNHIFQEAYRGMCEQWQQTGILVKERLKVRLKVGASGVILLYTFGYELPISFFVEGGIGIGITQQLAEFSTVLLVNPVDHRLVDRVDDGGRVVRACSCELSLIHI